MGSDLNVKLRLTNDETEVKLQLESSDVKENFILPYLSRIYILIQ